VEPLSDAELIAAVANGDRVALHELHDRHYAWLRARLARRCGDPDVVAEAIQDTFVAVWRGAKRFDGRGEPAAWLWGIAVRRLVGALRVRGRWDRAQALAARDEEPITVAAEEHVLAGIEHGELGAALRELSPELVAVVQATILDGLTTKEAAQLLRIPRGTVKTRLMRARQQLRGALT
jgi:RNA polymerase sigma-70 factor (ECF subfamily)